MLKKIFLWVILIFVVLLVVLALTINPLLSWSAGKGFNKFAPQIVGTPTTVDSVDVSVYQGRIEIDDLFVGNPQGFTSDRAFSLDKMVLEVAPSSLLGSTVRVEEIAINNPTIVIEYANGKTNLGEIQKHLKSRRPAKDDTDKKDAKKKKKGEGRKLSVNKIELTDADVQVIFNGKAYKVESPDIILENVAPEGVTAGELSLLLVEKVIGQVQLDVKQLPGQIGSQISQGLEKQLNEAAEQGLGLIKQLEQDTATQTDALRNLLNRRDSTQGGN